jgi:hypothetical protein
VSSSVKQLLSDLGISRLAHFTPSRNLPLIFTDGKIRSSKDMSENSPGYFTPTDLERFDRRPHMVCCSFQYPNPYYMAKARVKRHLVNYPDWVCMFLDSSLVYDRGAEVCIFNAAKANGNYVRPADSPSISACFASEVGEWERGARHRREVPTDIQAEVLVPGPISLSHLRGIVTPSSEAAACEWGRLRMLGHEPANYDWYVAPVLFQKSGLSTRLRFGGLIQETSWAPKEDRHGS